MDKVHDDESLRMFESRLYNENSNNFVVDGLRPKCFKWIGNA